MERSSTPRASRSRLEAQARRHLTAAPPRDHVSVLCSAPVGGPAGGGASSSLGIRLSVSRETFGARAARSRRAPPAKRASGPRHGGVGRPEAGFFAAGSRRLARTSLRLVRVCAPRAASSSLPRCVRNSGPLLRSRAAGADIVRTVSAAPSAAVRSTSGTGCTRAAGRPGPGSDLRWRPGGSRRGPTGAQHYVLPLARWRIASFEGAKK